MLWYIAAGSAIGGVSRYLLGGAVQRAAGTGFPAGTLVVNVTGSLLLGLFLRYAVDTPTLTPEWRAFLTIGFCGGGTPPFFFFFKTGGPPGGGAGGRGAAGVRGGAGLPPAPPPPGVCPARGVWSGPAGV